LTAGFNVHMTKPADFRDLQAVLAAAPSSSAHPNRVTVSESRD
jgi:hypothetical protein